MLSQTVRPAKFINMRNSAATTASAAAAGGLAAFVIATAIATMVLAGRLVATWIAES